MVTPEKSLLAPMVRKLEIWSPLDEHDKAAILALPHRPRRLGHAQYLIREGDKAEYSSLLISGFAFRSKVVAGGGRQILAVEIPGDMVDLQNSLLGLADHNVQAMTSIELAMIPREAILSLAEASPKVARAMWHETLVDGSISREWTANVGRRDAKARVAHLLCELSLRLKHAGLAELDNCELPLTQEQLGDCLGLTPVHVNRMLKLLRAEGLIGRTKRSVQITDWKTLAAAGDFNSTYLHLDLEGRPLVDWD
jgi:CRP-like cAMP-binding protein